MIIYRVSLTKYRVIMPILNLTFRGYVRKMTAFENIFPKKIRILQNDPTQLSKRLARVGEAFATLDFERRLYTR